MKRRATSRFVSPRAGESRRRRPPRRGGARPRARAPRFGLSLLEVMLALAILGLSLAAIGELVRVGARAARDARELSKAQLHCESVLAEVVAGVVPASPVSEAALDGDPEWIYSLDVASVDQQGLVAVTVTVAPRQATLSAVSFALTRWIPDPGLELPDDSTAAASSRAASYAGNTTSGAANFSNNTNQGGNP